MAHRKFINTITKRFKKLNAAYKEAGKSFEPEKIHAFRVEVKKLSAFLRMVTGGKTHGHKLKLPKTVMQFYSAAGDIRTLQLQREHIMASTAEKNSKQPQHYFEELKIAIDTAINHARKIASKKKSFKKEEEEIINMLRKKHTKIKLKKFIISISHRLQRLLAMDQPDDESLHLYRKLAKDIMYTWPWIEKEAIKLLPTPFTNYNRIKFLSDLLGEFHDTSIDLDILETQNIKFLNNDQESKILSDIQSGWLAKKENLGHKLYDRLVVPLI